MAQITITKSPLRSPITNKKASNHQIFFDAQTKVLTKKMMPLFKSPTKMAQITNKKWLKSTSQIAKVKNVKKLKKNLAK